MQHHAAFMQYLALQKGLQSEHCYWIYYESLNFFVSLVHSRETTNILFRKTVANKSCHQEERIQNFGFQSQSNSTRPGPYTPTVNYGGVALKDYYSPKVFVMLQRLICLIIITLLQSLPPTPLNVYLRLAYFLIIRCLPVKILQHPVDNINWKQNQTFLSISLDRFQTESSNSTTTVSRSPFSTKY